MARKKRLHELARELDVTTDRLMEIALRHGMRFSSNFNAVEPEQEEKLRIAVKGPPRVKKKPIVKIVKTAKQKAAEQAALETKEAEVAPQEELVKAGESAAAAASPEPEIVEKVEEAMPPELEPVAASVDDKRAEEEPAEVVEKEAEKAPGKPEEEVAEEIKEAVEEEEAIKEEVVAAKAEKPKVEETPLKIKIESVAEKPAKEPVTPEADAVAEKPKVVPTRPPKPIKQKIEVKRPPIVSKPKPAGPVTTDTTAAPPRRKRRRKRRKERVAAAIEETVAPKKKRAKKPTVPTVDHIMLSDGMTLKELADKLGIKAKEIIQKLLLERNIVANINHVLDLETAKWFADTYNVTTEEMSYEEEIALEDELKVEGESITRAPVVALLGHVDHGKTTLLDAIRESNVVSGEHGGITQHIGAYKIEQHGQPIVFLDTPGHEAFTRLRARGAQVTDIVLLIVAADDGVMPQTVEAIQHAKAAKVPILVVITKVDLKTADVERVKKGLADQDILVESWGGDVVSVEVSGKTGQGIDELLEMILLLAEMLNLKAYPQVKGVGTVLEARLDQAKGPVATVLVQNGEVNVGEYFLAGTSRGRVKAMIDDRGQRVETATSSTPVEIMGFSQVPEAGDQFQVVADESKARQMVAYRQEKSRASQLSGASTLSLDDLFSRIEEGEVKELPLIVKGDVRGSVEALSDSLEKVSTEKVKVDIKLAQPGAVTDQDILLASTTSAIVIGFNVRPQRSAAKLAEKHGVEIRTYNVIYEVIKDVEDAMRGMLEPTFREVVVGKAEVRQIFKVPRIGTVAGCYVTEGVMKRNAKARVIREEIVIHEGKVSSLKRFKDDVREVKTGYECGIGLDNLQDIREGDVIEMFIKEEVAAEL